MGLDFHFKQIYQIYEYQGESENNQAGHVM